MDSDTLQKIGRLIVDARYQLGRIPQRELARRLGKSVSTVSSYELGTKQGFTRAELVALEGALELTDSRLLIAAGFEPGPPPVRDGRPAVIYEGDHLTDDQRAEVLQFIEWLRFRDRG